MKLQLLNCGEEIASIEKRLESSRNGVMEYFINRVEDINEAVL